MQIFQHIYRGTWCRIRSAFEALDLSDEANPMFDLATSAKIFMLDNHFYEVDAEHREAHPHNVGKYVSKACERTLERIQRK